MTEERGTPREHSGRHRAIRVVAVIGVALVVLVGALLLLLHTSPARRYVLSRVTELLHRQNVAFDASNLGYNLLELSLSLRDLRVQSEAARDLPPFAEIERLEADLSLTSLIRGRYVLESGDASGVQVRYVVAADGRDNLPRPPSNPDQPGEPLDYLVEQLRIGDAVIRYEHRPSAVAATLPVRSIEVRGQPLTERHEVTLDAGSGRVAIGERSLEVETLVAALSTGQDDARFERVQLTISGSTLEASGTLVDFEEPRLDLLARGTADLARAAAIAGLSEPVAGTLSVEATVVGPLPDPVIDARVSGSQVGFRNLSDMALSARAEYDMGARRASISALEMRTPFGDVEGDGVLALGGDGTSHVDAVLSGLETAPLMRALDLPYVIATRADARVHAAWPGMAYDDASGEARASLTPAVVRPSRGVVPLGGTVDVVARGGVATATLRDVRAAGAEITGQVRLIGRRRLEGGAQVQVRDVGQSVSAAEAILGRPPGALLPVAVSGAAGVDAQVGGTLSAPIVAAELSAPALSVGEAGPMALAADVTVEPARATITRLDARWHGARLDASGVVALQGRRDVDLSVMAAGVQVADVLRAAEQSAIPATGTVAAHGRVTGSLSSPSADLTVTATDLVAYDERWGALTAQVGVTGRELAVAELSLDKPQPGGDGRLTGTGRYHLERRTYAIELRSQDLRLLGLSLPDGRELLGAFQMALRGEGSVEDPAGTLNVDATQVQLGGREIGDLVMDAVVADGRAAIELSAPTFATAADAGIGLAAPYPATATVRLQGLPLEVLPLDRQTPLEGQLTAVIDAEGPLNEVRAATATARIASLSGSWNGQPFAIDEPATLRYAGERLSIDRVQLTARDSRIEVSGELPVGGEGEAEPGTIAVDAHANLATLAAYAPAGTSVQAGGELLVSGVVRGTLEAIDPDLSMVITRGSLMTPDLGPGLSDVTVRATVASGDAVIEQLDATFGAARIAAHGEIPLGLLPALPVTMPRSDGPAEFTATVQDLDLSEVPRVPPAVGGVVSLTAVLAASEPTLEAVRGEVTFDDFQMDVQSLTLAQPAPSTIAIDNGTARVDRLALSGTLGVLNVDGSVELVRERSLAMDVSGTLNVAAIAALTDAVRAEGETTLSVEARGTIASPELTGFVELNDGSFVLDQPTVVAEGVDTRLDLSGRRVTISQLTGAVNGGTLSGSGSLELGGDTPTADLELAIEDIANDFPLDLRSVSDVHLQLETRGETLVLAGQVTIDEAGQTGDINFDEGLLAVIGARRQLDLTEERNPLLERVEFAVDVDTTTPILVDNNLVRAEVTADLRVVGTPYEPGLSGQLTVLEGGEILLNERRYEVERSVITFVGEREIVPSFDLQLHTSASHYDITLAISGTPGNTDTALTADPALPEPDIMALLVTGRQLEEMRGEEFEIAREQVLSYLAGRLGSQLGRQLEQATGLSTVRLEPTLIANEADPTARLTVGESITDDLELVYSVDLTNSNDQIWVAEYDITRRFQTSLVRQGDASYRVDFQHDVRFGGEPAPGRLPRQQPVVAGVTIENAGALSDDELRTLLDIEAGEPFDFFEARNAVDEVREALAERGRLQSRVRLRREGDDRDVHLTVVVSAGPVVELTFEGADPPGDILAEARTRWQRGVFDTQRLDDVEELLLGWLMRENYLQATVAGTVEDAGPDRRRAHFTIDRGARFRRVVLAFEGASGVDPGVLDDIIEEQDLDRQLFTDPIPVTELLERYYAEQGYLVTEIEEPRYEFQGTTARIVIAIREGPRFLVRSLDPAGNTVFTDDELTANLALARGEPFLPFAAENALQQVRDRYWALGHNDVRVDYELSLDRPSGQVDVRLVIEEGQQSIVAGVDVAGNDDASDRLVREQFALEPGEPLDLKALAASRTNLYETRAFSFVDVTRQVQPGGAEGVQPVRLRVAVREVQPFQVRYGASFDTERGLGGLVDVSNHNSLGKARVLGLRSRYDARVREGRVYFNQPSLLYWPVVTTTSVYYREEQNRETDLIGPLDVTRRGFSVQQEREVGRSSLWSYGFRYERAHSRDPRPGALFDERVTVSPLSSTLTRDTRDEILDATRGLFSSHALQYSPSWLDADQAYVKYFGQYFQYFALQPVRRERLTGEILRPRLVFAAGARLGLAATIDGFVPRSERFFAGGSTTLRGFEQNGVGPVGPDGIPLGGNAMLVLNGELRFPLISIFDGVAFLDVGNVYRRIADVSLAELRESGGVGLRVRTPWFLGRLDYGVPFDRRAGEGRSRLYISIGQAF